eukprot:5942372-Heterocapsa_arctica.AAC.1
MPSGETARFRHSIAASSLGAKKAKYGMGNLSVVGGIYLGRTLESNEFLVGTASGMHTSRTVMRRP